MTAAFLEFKPRNFNPAFASGLSPEVRDSVILALKAMSTWRNEIAATNEKNGKQVIDKMAAAAAALGWPEQVVEAARAQLQNIADVQVDTIDHLMDAWEQQVSDPATSPTAMFSKLQPFPGFGSQNLWSGPQAQAFEKAAQNTIQVWMSLAQFWPRAIAQSMAMLDKRH